MSDLQPWGPPLAVVAPAVGLPAAPTVRFSAPGHGAAQPTPVALAAILEQNPLSEVAVNTPHRRPGDAEYLQENITCMVDGPNKYLATEAATAVVPSARSPRKVLPDEGLSVDLAWIQFAEGSWEEKRCKSDTMGLVVSLRRAHGASSTTVRGSNPKSYLGLRNRRVDVNHRVHRRRPRVGDGSAGNIETPTVAPDNRVHGHPGIGNGSEENDESSYCRAGDQDHLRSELERTPRDMTADLTAAVVTRESVTTIDATNLAEGRAEGRADRARATDASGTGTAHGETLTEPAAPAPPRTT